MSGRRTPGRLSGLELSVRLQRLFLHQRDRDERDREARGSSEEYPVKAVPDVPAGSALRTDSPATAAASTIAPNTAISMVASRLRLKFIVPIEMPS